MNVQPLTPGRSRCVTKLPASTPLFALLRVLAGVPADVFRNKANEPIIVAHEGIEPGRLSEAIAAAQLQVPEEAWLRPYLIKKVIDLEPTRH